MHVKYLISLSVYYCLNIEASLSQSTQKDIIPNRFFGPQFKTDKRPLKQITVKHMITINRIKNKIKIKGYLPLGLHDNDVTVSPGL